MDNWNEMIRIHIAVVDAKIAEAKNLSRRHNLIELRQKLEIRSNQPPAYTGTVIEIWERLDDRAEVCRALADICESERSRQAYMRISIDYDKLAASSLRFAEMKKGKRKARKNHHLRNAQKLARAMKSGPIGSPTKKTPRH